MSSSSCGGIAWGGSASSRVGIVSRPVTLPFVCAFFASARLSAMASRILNEGVPDGFSDAAWLLSLAILGGRVFVGETGLEVGPFAFRDTADVFLRTAGVVGLDRPFEVVDAPTRADEDGAFAFRDVADVILRTTGALGLV